VCLVAGPSGSDVVVPDSSNEAAECTDIGTDLTLPGSAQQFRRSSQRTRLRPSTRSELDSASRCEALSRRCACSGKERSSLHELNLVPTFLDTLKHGNQAPQASSQQWRPATRASLRMHASTAPVPLYKEEDCNSNIHASVAPMPLRNGILARADANSVAGGKAVPHELARLLDGPALRPARRQRVPAMGKAAENDGTEPEGRLCRARGTNAARPLNRRVPRTRSAGLQLSPPDCLPAEEAVELSAPPGRRNGESHQAPKATEAPPTRRNGSTPLVHFIHASMSSCSDSDFDDVPAVVRRRPTACAPQVWITISCTLSWLI
jgi:hypothetical protein